MIEKRADNSSEIDKHLTLSSPSVITNEEVIALSGDVVIALGWDRVVCLSREKSFAKKSLISKVGSIGSRIGKYLTERSVIDKTYALKSEAEKTPVLDSAIDKILVVSSFAEKIFALSSRINKYGSVDSVMDDRRMILKSKIQKTEVFDG